MLRNTWFYKTVAKYTIMVGTFERNGHLEDLGVDGGYGQVTGFCEHSNESSGSVGNFWNSRRTINYSK
jgi:hypothetical protein